MHHPFASFTGGQRDFACASASPPRIAAIVESVDDQRIRPSVADRHDRAGPRGER
jgi:hypothetical protein